MTAETQRTVKTKLNGSIAVAATIVRKHLKLHFFGSDSSATPLRVLALVFITVREHNFSPPQVTDKNLVSGVV